MIRILFLALLVCLQYLPAYSWHNYLNRPEKILNYCEIERFGAVLCTGKGIIGVDNQLHSYGNLAVMDAAAYTQDTLLLIQGDGSSYSDGLYKMSKNGNFEVVMFSIGLRFITQNPADNQYYLGRSNGLLKSTNGLTWSSVPYFNGKDCRKMVFSGNKAAVLIQQEYPSNVYWSTNGCASWSSADTSVFFFQDIDFTAQGELVGMYADGSYSDGIYRYNPSTHLWDLLFFGCNSAQTLLPDGNSFWVGYLNGGGLDRYLPLQSFDAGLPNRTINRIKRFSLINTPSIICCTDSGAYFLTDYTSISNKLDRSPNLLTAYPNPFNSITNICYSLNSNAKVSIRVYNSNGGVVFNHDAGLLAPGSHTLQLQTGGWSSGVYICRLFNGSQELSAIKLLYCR